MSDPSHAAPSDRAIRLQQRQDRLLQQQLIKVNEEIEQLQRAEKILDEVDPSSPPDNMQLNQATLGNTQRAGIRRNTSSSAPSHFAGKLSTSDGLLQALGGLDNCLCGGHLLLPQTKLCRISVAVTDPSLSTGITFTPDRLPSFAYLGHSDHLFQVFYLNISG